MEYKTQSLTKYLNDLSAKLPAPGGGSAAAMNAAMGASLLSMVINFTLGKPKYSKYEKELKTILKKSDKLKDDFLNLVDLDILAYKSKDSRKAMDVPLMLARFCCEGLKMLAPLIKKTNVNLISDMAIAAIFLESAFCSARLNVDINLKILNDKKLTGVINKELGLKAKFVKQARAKMEEKVGKVIRG
ncbi:MAG: cyclodeaminase/cyclohydrolase family protein [Candidatus Omnitrophica bacterium]|nr:cyclodeaminase/cyclohydrolase family protein [Candidatus Omnitrophota bacterium]MCG2695777.1 cyclodeaminase/cyclohydrolase family protein [Candidatus Parcubacteria bacterium]MBU4302986.1 cyclodeaminase/cyclohydrolase family protein [Candidatus Omnitrophota bacterium]MBU4419075.1 cyclodeaminase/cyclohydrolase family protein [Candidatus Omnitrophota bacterium]MBU4467422.1 cyclodeaminase/cyclohydrolase family protein [Candidatus Omnitrophota bacterium]